MKEFEIYERGENYTIFKLWLFSPIFFISEREIIDKSVHFIHEGAYHYLATSVENYSEPNPNVVRCLTYINGSIISQDEDNFYYSSLNQLDAKVLFYSNKDLSTG